MRKFTKYPSNYVKADTTYREVSDAEFDKLVDSYKGERSWSLIVAELKGTYGLDMAKKVADAVIEGSSCIKASTDYTSTHPLKVDCPRGPYYIWEEFGTFKGSVNNPDTFISDARRIHTFDGFNSLDEVVDYVKKYF